MMGLIQGLIAIFWASAGMTVVIVGSLMRLQDKRQSERRRKELADRYERRNR